MPLVRITLPKGKSPEFRKAISQGVQDALVETFNVPKDDLFQIITEGAPQAEIVHTPSYLGIAYTDDLVADSAHRQRHAHHRAEEAALPPHCRSSLRDGPASGARTSSSTSSR